MKKNTLWLQLFAEDPVGQEGTPEGTPDPEGDPKPDPRKTPKYSDEDLDKIINARLDRWKKEQDEADRLKKMSAQERAAAERKALEDKLAELESREARRNMAKAARDILKGSNINLDDELISMLIGKDADTTKTNVDAFTKLYQKAVSDGVKDALKGRSPRTGTTSPITKEAITAVKDPIERQRLINENIELFKTR